MERSGILDEILIKAIYMILSIVCAIFVVVSVIQICPLLSAFSFDELQFDEFLSKTHFGTILANAGVINVINGKSIGKIIVSFFECLPLICIIFLILLVTLLIIYFIYTKWKLIGSYIKISFIHIALYLGKYITFGLCALIFYKGNQVSLAISMVVGTIFFLLFSLIQLFFFSILILKFILNISDDIKAYNNC